MALAFPTVVPVALFHDGPFRWRAAARLLDDDAWLQFDDTELSDDLAEKARILREQRDDSFVVEASALGPSTEVAAIIDGVLRRDGRSGVPDDARHPLERAALSIHEDVIVLERRPAGWVMTGGVVCFPTRWSPAEKIGRSMAEIHAPVPRYDTIAPMVDRLFDRLRPGALVWRPNWSVVGQPDRRLSVNDRQAPATMPADPETDLWLRVERQSLRRLVEHPEALVFTVRIHRWRLGDVVDQLDRTLIGELRSLPDDVVVYKNLDGWRHELAAYLERRGVG